MKTITTIILVSILAVPFIAIGDPICELPLSDEHCTGQILKDVAGDYDGYSKEIPDFCEDYNDYDDEAMKFRGTTVVDCVAIDDDAGELDLGCRDMSFNLWFKCDDIETYNAAHRVLLSNRDVINNPVQGLMIATGRWNVRTPTEPEYHTGVVAQLYKSGEERIAAKVLWNDGDLEDGVWYQVGVKIERDNDPQTTDRMGIFISVDGSNWDWAFRNLDDWGGDNLSTGIEWTINYDFKFEDPTQTGFRYLSGAVCDVKIFDEYVTESSMENELTHTLFPNICYINKAIPNPFNPETILTYALPNTGMVRLAVYDLHGREVARLVDGITPSGIHRETFNAIGLSSGVYFARLTADDFTQTTKLLLVK